MRIRLLETIPLFQEQTQEEEYLETIMQHASMSERRSMNEMAEREDRKDMEKRFQKVKEGKTHQERKRDSWNRKTPRKKNL